MFNKPLMNFAVLVLVAMLLLPTSIILIPSASPSSAVSGREAVAYTSAQDALLPEAFAMLEGDQLVWRRGGLSNQAAPPPRLYNVTLITGDSVLAWVAENGTILSVAVSPADPTKLGQNFLVLKMNNSTYVVPGSVDIRRFDLELFNIDLLIKEGYDKLPYIPVIIRHSTDIRSLTEQLKVRGGEVVRSFSIVPAFASKLSKNKAATIYGFLTSSKDIRKVWLDRKVHSKLDVSAPLIGAPDAWASGLNGSGVRIAILDTGIDSSHPDFFYPNGISKIERAVSFVDYDGDGTPDEPPNDYFGHGTHVASIAAGTGAKSASKYVGIAPGAALWNVKVLNKYGWGYLSWVIAGVEYAALGPDKKENTGDEADILNLSLETYWRSDGTDPLSLACDAAVDLGRIVVVAAGNQGGYFSIGSPAAARKVITVGATDKKDSLAWFSSCGPTIDYRVKPDIVAPGVDIWAALARGSEIEYWANQSRVPAIDVDGDGRYDYVQLSGTSMSTPHVSGAAALLKQLNPSMEPEGVKNVLVSTAKDLGYTVYEQGGGRINVSSAITTPILVAPATISFGVVTENKLLNTTITFTFKPHITPPDVQNITLSLTVAVRDLITRDVVEAARLNATTITIPLNEAKAVQLTINTTLPKHPYEGKVEAKVVGGPWENRTVHTILAFTRLNELMVRMINREGSPAANRPLAIFQHNATNYFEGFNVVFTSTDSNGEAHLYLPEGEFYIIGGDVDEASKAEVWAIADKVPIYGRTVVELDERNAREVNFDPAKPNQIFAAKRSSVSYWGWWVCQMTNLWYYPPTPLTYVTNTTLGVSFSYEYYDKSYFNVASPRVIDAPEWHNLIYWQSGITPPITYVANYSSLVKRVTEYRVSTTPKLAAWLTQHKWSPLEWGSWEFVWIMNVPRARVEWLTPEVYYSTDYEKYMDPPWASTPYWEYYGSNSYRVGESVYEVFGAHPLSTHLNTYRSVYYLYIWAHFFQDSYGHFFYNGERWPAGHIKIIRDNETIYEGDEDDTIWLTLDATPGKYKVIMDGSSSQYLSPQQHTELTFTLDESNDYNPPNLYIIVPNLNMNNTHPAGEVTLNVYIDDPRMSSEADVAVRFSVNDGADWIDAKPLEHKPNEPYSFSLGELSDAYVSLWINATDPAGNSISTKVIRGFYVSPPPPAPPKFNVSGYVTYGGNQRGTIYVVALNQSGGSPVNATQAGADGKYTLTVPAGSYYFAAFMDVNGDKKPSSAEPIGFAINKKYPNEADLLTINKDTENVNITLYDVDLTVSEVKVSPEQPTAGRPLSLNATIRNLGGSFAENFKVSLLVNNTQVDAKTISLYWDETKFVEFKGTPNAGTYAVKLVVDSDNTIPESNEGNNEYVLTVRVLPPSPTLADLPAPFIADGAVNTMIIVGASNPRGPCSAAHTIDVAAGMYMAFALGTKSQQGVPPILLDWQISNYDQNNVTRIFRPGNIITFGGPGVNLITWYYHSLTYRGIQILPAYMASDAQGVYIYSTATRSKYRMVNDYGRNAPVTDYAMIVLHYDNADSRYVLIVAGLSGYSTSEAAKWLSSYPTVSGRAVILRIVDNEGDGIIDSVQIAEIVP